jgi:PBSX family phage terminase large subunit
MTEISLKSLIIPTFYEVHRDIKAGHHLEYWLKGGRGSTKSSFISIEIILNLIKDPNIHAVCYRKIGNKLETSVYNQIKWAINALDLKAFFRYYKNPLKIEYIPTGQQILCLGLDDPENSRSIKLEFGYIKILWFEELKQFDGMKEIRDVKQSVVRGGDEALIFYSYNPPEDPRNWVNKEAKQNKLQRLVKHSTYLDVPPEWLGKPFFIEAEDLKNTNPLAYRNEYLGEEVGTGLNVFYNVDLQQITAEQINHFDNICEGVDWGYAVDPFVWVKVHYHRKYKTLYIFDEIYQVGLSNDDAIEKVIRRHTKSTEIIADSEEPKSIDDFDNSGLPIRGARKGPGSVSYGIKRLQGLKKIVIDPQRCPNAAREFTEYSYEVDKNEEIKSKFPDKDNHTIDAVRYSLEDEFEY